MPKKKRNLARPKKQRTEAGQQLANEEQARRNEVARANKSNEAEQRLQADQLQQASDSSSSKAGASSASSRSSRWRKRRQRNSRDASSSKGSSSVSSSNASSRQRHKGRKRSSRAKTRSQKKAEKGKARRKPGDSRTLRWCVALVYKVFGFPEPNEEYRGSKDVATYIHKALGLAKGSTAMTKEVVEQVYKCHIVGIEWDYDTFSNMDKSGRKTEIVLEPGELQIIADFYQHGSSIEVVHQVFNKWRVSENRKPVTEYTIRYALKLTLDQRMLTKYIFRYALKYLLEPQTLQINHIRQQGKERWIKARYRWVTHLLIRLGELKPDDLPQDLWDRSGPLPACFDPEKCTKICPAQIVWWDETHKKCHIGDPGTDTASEWTGFARDPDGSGRVLPVAAGGVITEDAHPSCLHVKYEKELRIALGVAVVMKNAETEEVEGKKCPIFEYSGALIKSHSDYLLLREAEIKRANGLEGQWLPYRNKPEGEAPNPYKARYGDTWEEEIAKTSRMKKYCDIRSLVTHIFEESANVMKGTKHENDFVVYHDALNFMYAKENKAWMKQQMINGRSYYKIWVLPENDLNSGTNYDGRPVGNTPELMPLDQSLNQDVHLCVGRHVAMTRGLDRDDPRCFGIDTPKQAFRAYSRVWEEWPPSHRIIEDVYRVVHSLKAIYDKKGGVIDKVPRSGHRAVVNKDLQGWGGKRVRKTNEEILAKQDEHWTHPDAEEALRDLCNQSLDLHRPRLPSD